MRSDPAFGRARRAADADLAPTALTISRSAILFALTLAACSTSDQALKEEVARFCNIPPRAITLWEVQRDPDTREPIAIASSGDHNDCVEDWKSTKGIMTKHY